MTAVSLRTEGPKRIGAGVLLVRQALIDLTKGIYWIVSGIFVLLAGMLWMIWSWIWSPLAAFANGRARLAAFWKDMRFPHLRLTDAVVRWGGRGVLAVLMIGAIGAAIAGLAIIPSQALPHIASALYRVMLFAGLAVVALAVVALAGLVMIRLFAGLRYLLRLVLTRQGIRVLAVIAPAVLAAASAILYAAMQPQVIIALIAGLALVAVIGGIAVISFGPTGLSLLGFGGEGQAHGALDRRVNLNPLVSRLLRQPGLAPVGPPSGSGAEGEARALPSSALMPAADSGIDPAGSSPDAARDRRSRSWFMPWRQGIAAVLLAVLAVLLAWLAGELLLRVFSAAPSVSAAKPAAPPSASVTATPKNGGPRVIQLLADGVPADVSWRLGYRRLTAQHEDAGLVHDLTLPEMACRAGALVVFGAASSEGAAARNDVLAERRARWLADWTRSQLAQCPGEAPAILAVSLGQAGPSPPRPTQRAVRLMAIPDEDLGELANNGMEKLQDMARVVFSDLADFDRFEACTLPSRRGEVFSQELQRVCVIAD